MLDRDFYKHKPYLKSPYFYYAGFFCAIFFALLTVFFSYQNDKIQKESIKSAIAQQTHYLGLNIKQQISYYETSLRELSTLSNTQSHENLKQAALTYLTQHPETILIQISKNQEQTIWSLNKNLSSSYLEEIQTRINTKKAIHSTQLIVSNIEPFSLILYRPQIKNNQESGYISIAIALKPMLNTLINENNTPHYLVSAQLKHRTVYQNFANSSTEHSLWCHSNRFSKENLALNITVCPSAKQTTILESRFSKPTLTLGFLLTLLSSVLLYILGNLQKSRESLFYRNKELQLIYDINAETQDSKDVYSALIKVLHIICTKSHWKIGHLYQLEDNVKSLEIIYSKKPIDEISFYSSTKKLAKNKKINFKKSMQNNKKPFWIYTPEKHPELNELLNVCKPFSITAILYMPIFYKEKSHYYFELFSSKKDVCNPHERRLAKATAAALSDIFDKISTKISLADIEERDKLLLQSAGEGIFGLDTEGNVTFANPAAQNMLGFSESELLNQSIYTLIHHSKRDGSAYPKIECPMYLSLKNQTIYHATDEVLWRKNGDYFYSEYKSTPIKKNGELVGAVVTFSDTTEKHLDKRRLEELAHYDYLTGLYNRAYFEESLKKLFDEHQKNIVLFYLDLDYFKRINDSLGHDVGDMLLIEVAKNLRKIINHDSYIARIGGDEFAVILKNTLNKNGAIELAKKVLIKINKDYLINKDIINIHLSIGISIYPETSQSPSELIKHADLALYKAKEKGRNRYQLYNQEIYESHIRRSQLEMSIQRSIENNELYLEYQPYFMMPDKRVFGIEAVIRWRKDNVNPLSTKQLIDIAEEIGFIKEIDYWSIQQACKDYKKLIEIESPDTILSINLSAQSISDKNQIKKITKTLLESGIEPKKITIELTESSIIHLDNEANLSLQYLNNQNFNIAIDDFGVSYSSLNRLSRLPINTLKIDHGFIKKMIETEKDQKIVKSIINLANDLNLTLIAEGVETVEQLDFLLNHYCHIIQGFLLSKPVSLCNILKLLSEEK